LLPEKHQEAIDKLVLEADEENPHPTLEAYFVNEALFEMIMAVPAELQVRKIQRGV
jgi:hypothetical protein